MSSPDVQATPDERAAARRVSGAVAWAALACLIYAVDRTHKAVTSPPFDPAAIISTARIDYFWRMATSFFVASCLPFAWGPLTSSMGERGDAWVRRAAVWAVVLATALAWRFA